MSTDGSHIIFEANDALTPHALPGGKNLYEWVDGTLELVNVQPNGTVVGGAIFGARTEVARQGENNDFDHAISTDGRPAFWSAGPPPQIYLHELTETGSRTVDISATQKTNGSGPEGHDPNGPLPAHYWTANAEGSLVYFTSPEQLTNDATAIYQPLNNEPYEGDLYQYNVATGKLSDITVDAHAGERAGVQGVLGTSEDGKYVYFAAYGSLPNGAPAISSTEFAKPFNIYVWHDGETTLVGTTDAKSGYYNYEGYNMESRDWGSTLKARTARVSPDGKYLAFTSISRFGINAIYRQHQRPAA